MRPMGAVPAHEERKFTAHRPAPERNQYSSRALVLQGTKKTFDDGDASMLAHGSVARTDPPSPTPASVSSRHEHAFLIAQQVARRRPDVPDRTTEKSAQRSSIRLVAENHPSLNSPGVVVQRNHDPPTERPLLWHSVGTPRGPEAEPCRNRAQVNVPQLVRSLRLDDRSGHDGDSHRFRPAKIRSKEASHRRRCQMESSPAEHLGDLDLTEAGTKQLQPADDVANQVRESVYRNRDPQQGVRAVLVDPSFPGTECRGGDVEAFRRLASRPAASCPEFEDCHALNG